MTDQGKKYIRVSLTLGLIAGVSALLIGLVNVLTADRIINNSAEKEASGLTKVFDGVTTNVLFEVGEDGKNDKGTEMAYVTKAWTATKAGFDGYIYKASGKNAYGSVSLLVGFDVTSGSVVYGNIQLLENTETYGTTLEDNYVSPYNKGDDKANDIQDVSCGATYGAKLIRSMVEEAAADVKGRI